MRKTDIINGLAARHGFTSYLEICTPTTGNRYGEIDRRQFTSRSRLMYRWCAEACDGYRIDYPIEGEAIEGALSDLRRRGQLYDVILVDPWHGYESSLRDMRSALTMLKEDGVLVVHDCSPPSLHHASPSYILGGWCGLTYAAMIDFVAAEPGLDLYTVDADFGCAIIRRRSAVQATGASMRPDPAAMTGWRAVGSDFVERYRYFDNRRADLLNLLTIGEFLDREGLPPPKQVRQSLWRQVKNICS